MNIGWAYIYLPILFLFLSKKTFRRQEKSLQSNSVETIATLPEIGYFGTIKYLVSQIGIKTLTAMIISTPYHLLHSEILLVRGHLCLYDVLGLSLGFLCYHVKRKLKKNVINIIITRNRLRRCGRIAKHWQLLKTECHRQRSRLKELMKVHLHLMCERVLYHGLGTIK